MRVACILFAFCIVGAYCDVNISEDEFDELFHERADAKTKEAEEAALKENEAEINKVNNDPDSPYKEGLNEMSNMPLDEFEDEKEGLNHPAGDRYNGLIEPTEERKNDPINRAKLDRIYADLDRQDAPASYDAVAQGISTTPKNQKSCGSCAAFAASGLHESCMVKAGAKLADTDLSEQYLVDCGFNGGTMNACGGATPDAYTEFFKNKGGEAPHEAKMPYLDRDPQKKCPTGVKIWQSGAKVTNMVWDYSCNAEKMKKLVAKYGAVMIAAYASDKGFSNYAKGVFTGCSTKPYNHALLVVGYGTENGIDYWKVKNSWGATWGDGGYAKIERGKNACNMETVCVVAECSAGGTAEAAPPTPKPKPVPVELQCNMDNVWPGWPLDDGDYTLNMWSGKLQKSIKSSVSCKNNNCGPKVAGPSNACVYICGDVKCPSN